MNIRRILKGFTLSNVNQSDALPIETIEDPSCSQAQLVESNAYQAVDALLASHNVKVRFGGNHTFYDSRLDLIGMPQKATYDDGDHTTALSCTNWRTGPVTQPG